MIALGLALSLKTTPTLPEEGCWDRTVQREIMRQVWCSLLLLHACTSDSNSGLFIMSVSFRCLGSVLTVWYDTALWKAAAQVYFPPETRPLTLTCCVRFPRFVLFHLKGMRYLRPVDQTLDFIVFFQLLETKLLALFVIKKRFSLLSLVNQNRLRNHVWKLKRSLQRMLRSL